MPEQRPPMPPTYFEVRESLEQAIAPIPPWKTLLAEQAAYQQAMRDGRMPVDFMNISEMEISADAEVERIEMHTLADSRRFARRGAYGDYHWPSGPDQFDLHNVLCFTRLPSIARRSEMIFQAMRASVLAGRFLGGGPDRAKVWLTEAGRDSFMQESLHWAYHATMWRQFGRRVYVLDDVMAQLLANTKLPNLPASILWSPSPHFYLQLPPGVFQFTVPSDPRPQWVDGIGVGTDCWEPDEHRQREISFFVVGKGADFDDCNIAYASYGLAPDGRLSDLRFADTDMGVEFSQPKSDDPNLHGSFSPTADMEVMVPRLAVGLILYLISEHPDLEPVPPAPRRDLGAIKNPAKRRKAEQQNARHSRLGYIYVGRKIGELAIAEQNAVPGQIQQRLKAGDTTTDSRRLDHRVWVSGHWRLQPYGKGRTLHRSIWIKPFVRGPDEAEAMRIRAAKIQHAKPKPLPPQDPAA